MRSPRTATRAVTAFRPRTGRSLAAVLVSAAAVAALTGCSGFEYQENICSSGEYPVLAVGNSGSDCVPDKEEPPAGYARYPHGKVPQHVDDKWDVYWRSHTLDRDGKITELHS
ncbi:SCO0607 family lipoprotein [Streptomyces actuosus]|uniref:Lipoprotein n=1 Tax=Streptomyces actuosus TaxID=1885 RepID=A0A2U9PCN9_STRAS|nr:hypothetical protein [Streptomyces actuosus]AWT47343.1 hypothetical protein DMT42_37285 [Streptomyces actuosus]MBM4823449.1 hypothetical protein [Streptomyces actuosus]